MDWENKTIGFAMCGSFCTFKKAMGVLEKLTQTGANGECEKKSVKTNLLW